MKTTNGRPKTAAPRIRTIGGRRFVMVEEAEYHRLRQQADEWEPLLPSVNERGNYPLEVLDVLLARKIIRHRRKLGLSQVELARRAGIRAETLNRIEQGRNKPSVPTIAKIDKALRAAEVKEK